ncbi:MAG TPA: hypothetical protein PK498_01400 [Candidatus Kapabacteria bacterium]|nr:hypothetical protein [Candidatus Kapabacteria bacterium]
MDGKLMEIYAKITGVKYTPILTKKLKMFNFDCFDINKMPACCLIDYNGFSFGLSKWVSPKRTRSYPYERVYNTLNAAKRITVIPIIKDEGKDGDRDFIQWDTISLMSLLDVYVVFAYYISAERNKTKANKITNQKFDNEYIKSKISEIRNYHSSALHWNLNEVKNSVFGIIVRAKSAYKSIGSQFKIEFHNEEGVDKFAKRLIDDVEVFIQTSRQKAQLAQQREVTTTQPKEFLSISSKATITIENYLGGKYYFTVDEVEIVDNKIYLTECKHTTKSILPSIGDIKDGLFKMILYTNLKDVTIEEKQYEIVPTLKLTSSIISENVTEFNVEKLDKVNDKSKDLIKQLFKEAKENNFELIIERVK